jgi:hypothetical protein
MPPIRRRRYRGHPKLTTIDAARGELFHAWPAAVPGGGILYTSVTGTGPNSMTIEAIIPGRNEHHTVVEAGGHPQYAPSGHLVFFRDGTFVAARFDIVRLQVTGPQARLSEDVAVDSVGAPLAVVSSTGALVYVSKRAGASRLVWISRQGLESPLTDRLDMYDFPRIAPDGHRIVIGVSGDLWVLDTVRSNFTRLTSDNSVGNSYGVWTRDGARVVFRTATGMRIANADGSGEPEMIPDTSVSDFPNAVTVDGTAIAVTRQTADRSGDVYLVSLTGAFKPKPLVSTPSYEGGAKFSPDGRWIVYASDESGRFEVYARPVSGPGRRSLVSAHGGSYPAWSPDGREIFYRQGDKMFAVKVAIGSDLTLSQPEVLFEQRFAFGTLISFANYDVDRDGQRFAAIKDQSNAGRLNVVLNWSAGLDRLIGR